MATEENSGGLVILFHPLGVTGTNNGAYVSRVGNIPPLVASYSFLAWLAGMGLHDHVPLPPARPALGLWPQEWFVWTF